MTPTRAARQTRIGLLLATAVIGAWLAVHGLAVFGLPDRLALLLGPLLVALQCWLSVGLFIVAHDAMHGSLAPGRRRLNRAVGRLALLLYAGMWFDGLLDRHLAHHRAPGTDHDPDFAGDGTGGPLRWYLAFFREYLTWQQIVTIGTAMTAEALLTGAAPLRIAAFWALPALLASVQLFVFGTYLPHRREDAGFTDRHQARSNDYAPLLSLLTCFHFGYHHEHHLDPATPWWRLPAAHRAAQGSQPRAGGATIFPAAH